MNKEYTIIPSKFKGYCFECYFTIWKNENIKFSGKARHIDCLKALKDETPRQLNPAFKKTMGKVTKNQMIIIIKGKMKVKGRQSRPGPTALSANDLIRRGTRRNTK